MAYRITTVGDTLAAVEVDGRGRDLGTFEVRVPTNKNTITARDALEELLDLRDTAPVMAGGVRDILQDVGFGRLTPNAIADGLLRNPEDLRATVEALHSVYPEVVRIAGQGSASGPPVVDQNPYAQWGRFDLDGPWS
jgi:hypothetical protein